MKKIIILFITLILLTGCIKKEESMELKKYNKYILELKEKEIKEENIPLSIKINVEEYKNNILSYTALIDRNDLVMKNIEAILIHNIETENAFPSTGIFDEKLTLDDSSKEKGIKLTGYVEKQEKIEFRLMIKYKDQNNKEQKYYYKYNYRQESTN